MQWAHEKQLVIVPIVYEVNKENTVKDTVHIHNKYFHRLNRMTTTMHK